MNGPMKKLLFILTLGIFVLSGCGQKGPLYLPEPEAQASVNQPAS